MLRIISLLLLPAAILLAACGGSGSEAEPQSGDTGVQTEATEAQSETSEPPASTSDGEFDDGSSGAIDDLFGSLDPFSMLGGFDSLGGLSGVSQDVDPSLTGALLVGGDLPAIFTSSEDFSFLMPSDIGSLEMAGRIFATGDLDSDDPGSMVMSIAMRLPQEALDEIGNIDDLQAEIERSFAELSGSGGLGFDGLELLDASSLGDGGIGMRFELDLSAMFNALAEGFADDGFDIDLEATEDVPVLAGIGMEFYFFFRDLDVLALMVMWPLEDAPDIDALELAEIMDERAGG